MLVQSVSTVFDVRLIKAYAAFAAGLLLVLIVGFAPLAQIHNAAHDTRHAGGFPCH